MQLISFKTIMTGVAVTLVAVLLGGGPACQTEPSGPPVRPVAQPSGSKNSQTTSAQLPMKPQVRHLNGPAELSSAAPTPSPSSAISPSSLKLPDVLLTNHAGQAVRLHELLTNKIAVIQTIFTSCSTICPPMGNNFRRLQQLVADQSDVALISISIDPITDIPERLAAWGKRFSAGDRWTLLTGTSENIRSTLKALRSFSAEKQDHSSMVAVGHHSAGVWTRIDGLSDPKALADAIAKVRGKLPPSSKSVQPNPKPETSALGADAAIDSAAKAYFTDVELVDQRGKRHRLYSDLIQGKVVLANSFFTSCGGVCPIMTKRLADVQSMLQDRMNKELFMISLSVDPVNDTPQRMAAYAAKHDAGPGWLFLSGEKANVEFALHKLGFAVEARESHSNLFIIGNEPTGLWKKAFGLAEPAALLEVVNSVLNDHGESANAG